MERPAVFNREFTVCTWSVLVTVVAGFALLVSLFWEVPTAQAESHSAAIKPAELPTPIQTPVAPDSPAESPLTFQPNVDLAPVETPVALTPALPQAPLMKPSAIAVFPLVQHGDRSKAFSDLPVIFSTSVARQLSNQFALSRAPFKVLNPIYSYDTLSNKNYAGLYKKMVNDTLEAGEPRESDVLELVNLLSTPEYPVEWVMLTRSTLDFAHPKKPTLKQWPMAFIYDEHPADPNWFIEGQVQLYHVTPGLPLIWQSNTKGHVTWSQLGPVSSSILGNSDSLSSFQAATGTMAKTLIKQFPKQVYLPQATVHAKLSESPDTPPEPIGLQPEEQSLLKRILQR